MGACAFIDILGFTQFVQEDTDGAAMLLQNYQMQISTIGEPLPENEKSLTPYKRDSFKYFIPFSDSIFIYTENNSDFVEQLAHFVHSSFSFTSNAFCNPDDPSNPENVIMKSVVLKQGKIVTKERPAKWYPLLFRGGIGSPDVKIHNILAIHDNKEVLMPILLGDAVIEAVKYESLRLKGPRIYCSKEFYDTLNDRAKSIVHPAFDQLDLYEIYWPAILYLAYDEMNGFFLNLLLINDFYLDMLVPAVNLWKAYNHRPISEHYFSFLRLIVKGTLNYFVDKPELPEVKKRIIEYLEKEGLKGKVAVLMS